MSVIIGVGIIAGIKFFKCLSHRFASFNSHDDYGCVSNRLIGNNKNLYLSFDIEVDKSYIDDVILSIGICGFDEHGKEVVSYQRNLEIPPDNVKCKKDMFWDTNPEIYNSLRVNLISPTQCMIEINNLYHKYNKTYEVVWVARSNDKSTWQWLNIYYDSIKYVNRPGCYNWSILNNYNYKYLSKEPGLKFDMSISAKCVTTALWLYCKKNGLSEQQRNELWYEFKGSLRITHNPLDDARCQGKVMFEFMDKYGIVL